EIMHRATRDLAEAVARQPGLGVGDEAPRFRLQDQDGNVVDSADLLAEGPLVVALFRGHW
ncbi:MAG: AhpC/TSA family protein, partial [Acidobacteriota bacterium]